MGPVTVIAAPTYYVVDFYWLYESAKRYPRLFDLIGWDYYYTDEQEQTCADASAYWITTDEELRRMEDTAPYIEHSSLPLESYVCDRIPGKPICIDFFIMNRRSAVFAGDDRDFNPFAGINSSRVQLYINPSTLEAEARVNSTRIRVGMNVEIWPVYDSVGLFTQQENVPVSRASDGHIEVRAKFYNNYCTSPVECPAIDARIHLISDPSKPSGYDVAWVRNGFPSMGIYKLDPDGSTYVLAEDRERIRDPWLNWLALIDGVRNSNQVPPGCNLQ